jgi:hypothetical protein
MEPPCKHHYVVGRILPQRDRFPKGSFWRETSDSCRWRISPYPNFAHTENGWPAIDNNLAENALREIAFGRKNCL